MSGSLLSYVRAPARIIFALALTIILGGLAIWTWSEFSVFRSDAETIVSATALTMDDLARNSLDRVDGVLETVVGRIEEKGIDNFDSEAERAALRRLARPLPDTGVIVLANKDGNIVAAMPSLQSPLNVSDREWFRSLKAGGAEPQVSRARDSTPEARFFPVARSIRGPDKAFVGAVQASIARSHFANIFQSLDSVFRTLDVKPDEKLGVYRTTDGAVVATFPMADALLDETVAASPYVSLLANSEGESWMGWTLIGGKKHLVAARRMREWPLIVSVSLPERTVYSGAWNRLLWRSMITIVAIAALSMLTLLSGRQARREAALMGELEHRVKNTLSVVATVIERARAYFGGLRVSELVSLTWSQVIRRDSGEAQQSIVGKGDKAREVLIPAAIAARLFASRGDAPAAAPVFQSVRRPGNPLTERAVNFIVNEAAERAGINPAASIHWLRHAHASHAIDNGAPITLVSATLGHADLKTTSVYAHARPGESSGCYLKSKL